ncbi:hypothetical protein HI914_05478 [Erysiphe necator]|nr:hypothetical protein HI914_05478 [Erysiphe necator]
MMSDFKSFENRSGAESSAKFKEDFKNISFSLQVVSPSADVPRTLDFHDLPITLQVKDLKKLIRDSLFCRPPDELQRLIHHGRMLTRETETMSEIFGEEALKNSEVQVVHLVLRPGPEGLDYSRSKESKANDIPTKPISMRHSTNQAIETPTQILPSASNSQGSQILSIMNSPQYLQQQNVLSQLEELQSLMGQRLLQLQHETQRLNQGLINMGAQASVYPNLLESHQNEQISSRRSINVTQDSKSFNQENVSSTLQNQTRKLPMSPIVKVNGDRASGNTTHGTSVSKTVQESLSNQCSDQPVLDRKNMISNVEKWQESIHDKCKTISNEPSQENQHNFEQYKTSSNDLRSILRNSNRPNILNQQHISPEIFNSSPESLRSRINSSPSIPTSFINPAMTSIPFGTNPKSTGGSSETNHTTPNTSVNNSPLVYILSSPSEPRAILISNSHYYFTPSRNPGRYCFNIGNSRPTSTSSSIILDQSRSVRRQARETRIRNEHVAEPGAAARQPNLRVGGIGIQVGQILWLIIRLAALVWFLTADNSSWSRWLIASGLAFSVFIVLTGVLNGAVEQFWSPVRRHLETLVPLAPVHPPNIALQQNGNPELARGDDQNQALPQSSVRNDNVDELRRENDNLGISGRAANQRAQSSNGLFITRMRRLEQSLILFVVSLVPGVSERHIAHREAQANREIERQQQLMQIAAEQASRASNEATLSRPNQERENRGTDEQN